MKRTTFLVLSLITLALMTATAAAKITGEQVISAMKHSTDAIRDYRVDVTMNVKSSRMSVKGMKMTIFYKKPNKIHVDAKQGFGVMPSGTFVDNSTEELTRGMKPIYVKSEKKLGRKCHVVRLEPVDKSSGMPKSTMWVDSERNVVVAMKSDGKYAASSEWKYEKVDGKYYVPSEVCAEMPSPDSGQKATVSLKFENYRVNKGISDKVFEQKAKPAQKSPRHAHSH